MFVKQMLQLVTVFLLYFLIFFFSSTDECFCGKNSLLKRKAFFIEIQQIWKIPPYSKWDKGVFLWLLCWCKGESLEVVISPSCQQSTWENSGSTVCNKSDELEIYCYDSDEKSRDTKRLRRNSSHIRKLQSCFSLLPPDQHIFLTVLPEKCKPFICCTSMSKMLTELFPYHRLADQTGTWFFCTHVTNPM